MKYDLLTHAFNAAQHVPQLNDYLKLHFNLLGADVVAKTGLKKSLLTFTWRR